MGNVIVIVIVIAVIAVKVSCVVAFVRPTFVQEISPLVVCSCTMMCWMMVLPMWAA